MCQLFFDRIMVWWYHANTNTLMPQREASRGTTTTSSFPRESAKPATALQHCRLCKHSQIQSNAKRMVRNHCILTIFQFVYLPVFQLNCYFWREPVIGEISVHRLIFALPPLRPDRVYYKRAAMQKERRETIAF